LAGLLKPAQPVGKALVLRAARATLHVNSLIIAAAATSSPTPVTLPMRINLPRSEADLFALAVVIGEHLFDVRELFAMFSIVTVRGRRRATARQGSRR
jgi:hypothetical protein